MVHLKPVVHVKAASV